MKEFIITTIVALMTAGYFQEPYVTPRAYKAILVIDITVSVLWLIYVAVAVIVSWED